MSYADDILKSISGRSLYSFKKGDTIKRTESKPIVKTDLNENLGMATEVVTGHDNSFMMEPIEFLGISQGLFYYRELNGYFKGRLRKCAIWLYDDENWDIYEVPDFLDGQTIED
jgi:hypothetical protein